MASFEGSALRMVFGRAEPQRAPGEVGGALRTTRGDFVVVWATVPRHDPEMLGGRRSRALAKAEARHGPLRLPLRDWRAIALEVAEIGAAAGSLQGTMAELMALLQRHIGFDSAALAPLSGNWTVTWNKPAQFEELWRQRGSIYVKEVADLVRVALGDAGVAHDAEVLPLGVRDRAAFYTEYLRPLGGGSFACIGLTAPRGASGLSLTRYGGGRFHDTELALLRRLRPYLTLAVRGLEREAFVPRPALALAGLTAREQEFSHYVARGLTNGEIASVCGCSPNTVRNRLASVFRKAEVTTRAELAALIASGES